MKTYKNLNCLRKRFIKYNGEINVSGKLWNDWGIVVEGKTYKMIKYGPAPGINMGCDWMIWKNKKTGNSLEIKYDCPSFHRGINIKPFKFIEAKIF